MFNFSEKQKSQGVLKEKQKLGIENHNAFLQRIEENQKTATPEQVIATLTAAERYAQLPDRRIEIYTDPELDTFCCGQVASKMVTENGEIKDDPVRKTYLIGVPFKYAAGNPPAEFMRGEVLHERGHALVTDYGMIEGIRSLAARDGKNTESAFSLWNCVEDPRMERVIAGGPLRKGDRLALWEKNRLLIIPSIAENIMQPNIPPPIQFKFLLKLEGLWAIHGRETEGLEKPWDISALHPRVQEEFHKVEAEFFRLVGSVDRPPIKVSKELFKIFEEQLWPAYCRLLNEFPIQEQDSQTKAGRGGKPSNGQNNTGQKNGEKQEGKGSENTDGQSDGDASGSNKEGEENGGNGEEFDPEGNVLDPNNPDTWPDNLKKIWQNILKQHSARLEKEAERIRAEKNEKKQKLEQIRQEMHQMQSAKDKFETPEAREEYQKILSEIRPVINQLKRTFDTIFPKVDEPSYEWGRRGTKLSIQRLIRKLGTGQEQPLGRKEHPEEIAFILQIIVDVSGSMYGQNRIQNAVKAVIATCEAAQDKPIAVEVLASDDKNFTIDAAYEIKSFSDPYDGRAKARIISMQKSFGGDNEDADSIRASIPRVVEKARRDRAQYDRIATLSVFISDSTTESEETRKAAEEARSKTKFEGTAITNESEIAEKVRYHFGKESIIPPSIEEFPSSFQQIILRNVGLLRRKP